MSGRSIRLRSWADMDELCQGSGKLRAKVSNRFFFLAQFQSLLLATGLE